MDWGRDGVATGLWPVGLEAAKIQGREGSKAAIPSFVNFAFLVWKVQPPVNAWEFKTVMREAGITS
jgi:hypothetical protein